MFSQRSSGPLAIYILHIDTQNLLALGIGNDSKVQGMGVLVVELGVAVVGQTLLETALKAPSLIHTNSPAVEKDLGHISDADTFASLDHSGISPGDFLNHIQVFQGEGWGDILNLLPLLNLGFGQVRHNLGDLSRALLNDDGKSTTIRSRRLTVAEGGIFGFPGLSEGNAVELEDFGTSIFTHKFRSGGDLHNRQLI